MKTSKNNSVSVNTVANYAQAHAGARSMRAVTGTISQAAKALGGIGNELITIGKNGNKEKLTISVKEFFESLNMPYGNGRIMFQSINARWEANLRDKEDNFMICKNVIQRVKIGKQRYALYTPNEEGEFKTVSVYEPAVVRSTGWTPYLICEGIAQSAFYEEVAQACEESKREFNELKENGLLYVHDSLTDEYVPYLAK